jgi:peptidyl-prolyl cis-trans isomerase D
MLKSFRRASKSTIGTAVIAFIGILILIGFAGADMQSVGLGGSGLSSDTLAKVGSLEVTDRDMDAAMQRRLAQVRQENPEADYSALAGDFEPLLQDMIAQRALREFARKNGLVLSKRLIDAEIANIPGVRGLDGRASPEASLPFLTRQRMTDEEVRELVSGNLLERLLVIPGVTDARVPVGVATPYASMLLEERQGQVAMIPIDPFMAGLNPTGAQLQQYYNANRNRYMVPEQRVLKVARIGPEQVANVTATQQEVEAYYKANQAVYGAKDIRRISQAVVPDQKVAAAIAQRARSGQSLVEAAKPAGFGAADVQLGPQTRQQFSAVAGEKVAAAAFAAGAGELVGPIQSDLGWHVIKIEAAETRPGKSFAQARDEIATQITSEKRENALADIVNGIQDSIDDKGSSFDEAARAAGLTVTTTPRITADGTNLGDPGYAFPADLAPALKSGFELAPTDEPVVDQLEEGKGFALVAPAEVIPAAPPPLANIRDRVRDDWIRGRALQKAKQVADAIAAKAAGKGSLADALKQAGVSIPPPQSMRARRIQLSEMGERVPAPLQALFSSTQGRTQVGLDSEGRGYFVVKVDKVIPGNPLNQPGIIAKVQNEFAEPLAQEYARQLLSAMKQSTGVERNEAAIAAAKKRIVGGS